MTSSIGNNPSISLLDLPPEMLDHTFQYVVAGGGFSSLALTNRQCKETTDAILRSHWLRLKLPNTDLLKGLVDLPSLIGRIEQLHPADFEISPSSLFHELANEFASLGATLPKGNLPLTPSDLQVLQRQAEIVAQERALVAIWPKIAAMLQAAPQLQTADQIRTWLNDPNNAPILNQITSLDLFGLNLRVLPPEIARLTQLISLDLKNNRLSSLPDEIGALAQLDRLKLNNNQLSSLPDAIRALTQLQILILHDNQLSSLPDAIGALTQLKELSIFNNKLTSLPDAIGSLTLLKWLELTNNQLSSLPDTIGNLTELEWIALNDNQLTSLPNTIGALTKMNKLPIKNNKLRSLPDSIRTLTGLLRLELSNNQLISLPDAIDALKKLNFIELDGNPLMFISNKVLNSDVHAIKTNEIISNYKQELEHPISSPLAQLYQSIIQRKPEDKIQKLFSSLSSSDKELVFEMIEVYAENPQNSNMQWGEHHRRFYLSVRDAISLKLERLPTEKKNQVYGAVYQLNVYGDIYQIGAFGIDEKLPLKLTSSELQLGKDHALDNRSHLADAMAALDPYDQQEWGLSRAIKRFFLSRFY